MRGHAWDDVVIEGVFSRFSCWGGVGGGYVYWKAFGVVIIQHVLERIVHRK